MASRRASVIKSRTSMGPISISPSGHTPRKRGNTPIDTSKYSKSKSSSSDSICCYYQNHILFTCLCIWSLIIIFWLFSNYKTSHSYNQALTTTTNNNIHTKFTSNENKDPAWKHPIQPWEILPRPPKGQCTWKGPFDGFLSGCAGDGCKNHNDIKEAKEKCSKDELCTGIIKVAKNREIYQLRSGAKISDSPSGEQSWQKQCGMLYKFTIISQNAKIYIKCTVVDEEKLDKMHKKEMNKLDGKESENKNNKKEEKKAEKHEKKLVDRMSKTKENNKKNAENDGKTDADNEDNKKVKNFRNLVNIESDDPWARFIPEMAKIDLKSHHVKDVRSGYERPFGEIIGELGIDEKEMNLKKELLDPSTGCFLEGPIKGFIANCGDDNCENHQKLDDAIDKCLEQPSCTGVVQIVSGQQIYQIRSDKTLRDSPRKEVTWIKLCGEKALERIHEIASEKPPPQCFLDGPIKGFLGNCAGNDCKRYYYFNDASVECESMGKSQCVGITRIPGLKKSFELRAIAPVISSDSGEYSYLLTCNDEDNDGDGDGGEMDKKPKVDLMDDPVIAEYEKIGNIIEVEDHRTNEMVKIPTIFIGIASYRDPWCWKSVHTAFTRARYPERIFIGVVQQNAEGDPECITPQVPCDEDPTQVLCKYVDHITVKKIHAKDAAGPTFGRHHADKMYNGEYFAVQVDAHMSFIKDWDMIAIEEWTSLDNEYAILTTYPSETKNGMDDYGNPLTHTAPIICDTRMLHSGMFKHEGAGEINWPETHKDKPMLSPFLGAGILFSRGHRIVRVPYDCCLPMVFDGEEFSLGVRAWTHGYDLYAPSKSFVYHPYNRKKRPPLFWEQNDGGRLEKSQNRIKKILGMPLEKGQETNYDSTQIERYGLGKQRKFETYLKVFGINLETKQVYNHCPEAFAGILHDRLHAFLRPNKRGINYENVFIAEDAKDKDDGSENGEKENKKWKRKKSYLNVKEQKEPKRKIGDD